MLQELVATGGSEEAANSEAAGEPVSMLGACGSSGGCLVSDVDGSKHKAAPVAGSVSDA